MHTTATRIQDITEIRSGIPNPLHEVTDPAKLADLVADMAARGWQGSPIVVDGEWALTGSHRIAAHTELWNEQGIDVPIPQVEIADLCAAHGVDWAMLRADADEWGGGAYDAAILAVDLLPADVVDYLGLDLH